MNMSDVERCWGILPKVSRSFALCIRVLPKPLDEQMMVSYLIYRIIDTIEDSNAPVETKKELFKQFVSLLSMRELDDESTENCKTELLTKLNYTYERELLENLQAVLQTYYSQPLMVRRSIRKWGREMADGMYKFQKKPIDTFEDQNLYSYYVAGVIGYLFNDLLYYNRIITRSLKRKLHRYAREFGLALQKVNILRDIAYDALSKRRYWPRMLLAKYGLSYGSLHLRENKDKALQALHEQIRDAQQYLHSAIQYILLLPENAIKVRRFCLIPLFMAIESYVKCANNYEVFESGKVVKITREQVHEIVEKSDRLGSSNERLMKWFTESMLKIEPVLVGE
ncbi:hypothetical protein DRN67_02795, partial [Candidatus Micrarchaeota archaeon]